MKKKLRLIRRQFMEVKRLTRFNAIMPPIYQTSTYVQDSPGKHKTLNTVGLTIQLGKHFENSIASLEEAKYGLGFGSGLAAIDAVIKLLAPGMR